MRLPVIAVAIALLALPAQADTRDERLAVASQYIEATLADLDMNALIDQMWKPVVRQIEASGTEVSTEKQDRIAELYRTTFTDDMQNILRGQAEVMADIYTLEEIEGLKAFYDTPTGRAVMQKLPQVMAKQQPAILSLVQGKLPSLLKQIQEIMAN